MVISSVDCLDDDPLSAPYEQILPTCLAPHFMSLNRFLDCRRVLLGQEKLMLTKCVFVSRAAVISYPSAFSSLLEALQLPSRNIIEKHHQKIATALV